VNGAGGALHARGTVATAMAALVAAGVLMLCGCGGGGSDLDDDPGRTTVQPVPGRLKALQHPAERPLQIACAAGTGAPWPLNPPAAPPAAGGP